MKEGLHKYELKPLQGELMVNIYQKMYDEVCDYVYIFGTDRVTGSFVIDKYSEEPLVEQLVDRLSRRIAVNLTLSLIEHSETYEKENLLRSLT